jgi:exodeoxyribonuclease V alpha subunit
LQEDTDGTHPLAQQVVMLRHSRRFGEGSGIGQLARWVNQQQPDEARKLLAARSHDDVFSCPSRTNRTGRWSACCSTAMAKDHKVTGIT